MLQLILLILPLPLLLILLLLLLLLLQLLLLLPLPVLVVVSVLVVIANSSRSRNSSNSGWCSSGQRWQQQCNGNVVGDWDCEKGHWMNLIGHSTQQQWDMATQAMGWKFIYTHSLFLSLSPSTSFLSFLLCRLVAGWNSCLTDTHNLRQTLNQDPTEAQTRERTTKLAAVEEVIVVEVVVLTVAEAVFNGICSNKMI